MGKEEAEAQRLKKRCEGGADERTWQSQQYCQEGTGVCKFPCGACFSYLVPPPAEERED